MEQYVISSTWKEFVGGQLRIGLMGRMGLMEEAVCGGVL